MTFSKSSLNTRWSGSRLYQIWASRKPTSATRSTGICSPRKSSTPTAVYYSLPPESSWRLFGGEAPRGDRYPFFAVTWPATGVEVARAVLAAEPGALRLRLYSFEKNETLLRLRLWRLKPGRHEWRAGTRREEFTVTSAPHMLSLPVPPAREQTVVIAVAGSM